jgi:hypothetical protein
MFLLSQILVFSNNDKSFIFSKICIYKSAKISNFIKSFFNSNVHYSQNFETFLGFLQIFQK